LQTVVARHANKQWESVGIEEELGNEGAKGNSLIHKDILLSYLFKWFLTYDACKVPIGIRQNVAGQTQGWEDNMTREYGYMAASIETYSFL
jgi:hypothetical protein